MTPPGAPAKQPASVVVVGAGIAGLAFAYRLHRLAPHIRIIVVDAAPDVAGGKLRTSEVAGLAVDEAADAFLARHPAPTALCTELGLADRLTQPAAREALLVQHGELHRIPAGLVLGVPCDLDALRASGVVSPEGVDRAALDLTAPADGPPPARRTRLPNASAAEVLPTPQSVSGRSDSS